MAGAVLKDLRLGVSKRPYLQRFIAMMTQIELLKLHHFLPSDTDTDTGHVNPTRRPRPTNLQNLVTIMESEVRVATFEG